MAEQMPANACPIDVHQELHLDGKNVKIIDKHGNAAEFQADNQLIIKGKAVLLSSEQSQQLQDYREQLNTVVPKAKEIAKSGVAVANEVIDDLSASFNNTKAFENVRSAVASYYDKLEKRYYQNGEMVLKPDAFKDVYQNWSKDFSQAKEVFNREFFASAFTVLQEKMKSDKGVDFSALQQQMAQLQVSVQNKLKQNSKQVKKQAQQYCDSMKALSKQEKGVVATIPELKNYQLFEI